MSSEQEKNESSAAQGTGTMNTLERTLSSVMEAGRDILAKRRLPLPNKASTIESLVALCKELLDHRGEASGLALAGEIADRYWKLDAGQRLEFFAALATDFDVDAEKSLLAAEQYRDSAKWENLWEIHIKR